MSAEFPKEKNGDSGVSRRDVLKRALFGAVALGLEGSPQLLQNESTDPASERDFDLKESVRFNHQIEGFRQQYGRLKRNEILFIDSIGGPLGPPVKLEETLGRSPGEFDQDGVLIGEIDQGWLDFERERVCGREHAYELLDIPNGLPRQLNVIPQIRAILRNGPGRSELDPQTFHDIVKYFGRKPVEGVAGENRIHYLRSHGMDHAEVPEDMRTHLSRLLPGLAAEESQFNSAIRSGAGAVGVLQFMPATWHELGYQPEQMNSFVTQTEAIGKDVTSKYRHITSHAVPELAHIKAEYFNDDESDFNRHFLLPVLLNSYNSGQSRMVNVIRHLVQRCPTRSALEQAVGPHTNGLGMDAYQHMTFLASRPVGHDHAVSGYGRQSSQYVAQIFALAELLDDE
jgi:hypothetical protein